MPKYMDSRGITNMIPSSMYNKFLKEKYNFTNDNDYRLYLQRNGKKVTTELNECDTQSFNKLVVCPVCKNTV